MTIHELLLVLHALKKLMDKELYDDAKELINHEIEVAESSISKKN